MSLTRLGLSFAGTEFSGMRPASISTTAMTEAATATRIHPESAAASSAMVGDSTPAVCL